MVIRATRQAWSESGGDDVHKRLMVVPNCHVTRSRDITFAGRRSGHGCSHEPGRNPLTAARRRSPRCRDDREPRIALLSFEGVLNYDLIGTNLVSHLRSNYAFRLPRAAFPGLGNRDLQASALFVKCRTDPHPDGSVSHFHLQITASGLKGLDANSEAEFSRRCRTSTRSMSCALADEDSVVVNVRGVGEIQPNNPATRVSLSAETDEFNVRRAFVSINPPKTTTTPGTQWMRLPTKCGQIFAAPAGAARYHTQPRWTWHNPSRRWNTAYGRSRRQHR